jgi:hypothetical protein
MDLSDASEKIRDTTGDRSGDLPTSSTAIKPDIITLLYQRWNKSINKTIKMLQCISREKVIYFIILSLVQQYNCFRVNNNVRERSLLQFAFYIVLTSPDDGRNRRPEHVVYVVNKLMLHHLWCCIGRITTEDVN